MTDRLRRIAIHIGCHKTGSTSIQDFAFENNSILLKSSVYYPAGVFEEFPRQHSKLYTLLSSRNTTAIRDVFDKIVRNAKTYRAETVFLSGEDLCAADPKGIRLLSDIVDEFFQTKDFIIVVRNPKDYILSQFKHHMRYAPTLTEVRFKDRKFVSPQRAIENWLANFSVENKILSYDGISDKLLQNFYRDVFKIEVQDHRRSNASQDFLTICIHNIFLKRWSSREIDKIHWVVAQRHREKFTFKIEDLIAEDLVQGLGADWQLPAPASVEKSLGDNYDPVEVCDKMLTLFSMLKEHFLKLKDEPVVGGGS